MRIHTMTILAVLLASGLVADGARADLAGDILKESGVTGGLAVRF